MPVGPFPSGGRTTARSNRLLAEAMPNALAFMVPAASHGWGPAQYPDLHRRMVVAWIEDQPLPKELAAEETPVPTASATVAPHAR